MTGALQRRLAAIVSVDVAGYSRLMGRDERRTLAALKQHRAELIDVTIAHYGGRIVKTAGDGMLLEFASVVSAVECCVKIQQGMVVRNALVPPGEAIRFRIGIHLGDVIIDGDDIFGDGVNIAARLRGKAEPDGIAISAIVRDYLDGETAQGFIDHGEQELKNIGRPIRMWQRLSVGAPDAESSLALPDKPSIAVLPFDNLSGDPEQEFFSDGITEDIITALSKLRWLFVIARNSTFTFKGQAVDVRKIARELGVRYVLEGSIRKSGPKVRISAQLIDAATGSHIWADRYDRSLEDIFAIQDEITTTLVGAIEPELGNVERERILRKPPASLDAWEFHQRGMWHVWKSTRDDIAKADALFEEALKRFQDYAPALAGLAYVNYLRVGLGFDSDAGYARDDLIARGVEYGRRAIAADARDYFSYLALARVLTVKGKFDEAIDKSRFALELNPNTAHGHHALGVALLQAGWPEDGLLELQLALRLSPLDPHRWATKVALAFCYYLLHEYHRAEDWARKSLQDHSGNVLVFSVLAASLAQQGRAVEAREACTQLRAVRPDYAAKSVGEAYPYKNPDDRQHVIEGLDKAGVPLG